MKSIYRLYKYLLAPLFYCLALLSTACSNGLSDSHDNYRFKDFDYQTTKPWFIESPAPNRIRFVSPDGTGDGSSEENAMSLNKAIASAQPGDLNWLLEGDYYGPIDLRKNGTDLSPIIWRSLPGEAVKFYGAFTINAQDNWIWGIVFLTKEGINCDCLVEARAAGAVLINNIIFPDREDTMALASWNFPRQIVYGNIIGSGHHNIYTQNTGIVSPRWIVDNISFDARNGGPEGNGIFEMHAYTESSDISGFRFIGNIFAHWKDSAKGRFLLGGKNSTPNSDNEIISNIFYKTSLQIGYARPSQAAVIGNTFFDTSLVFEWLWADGESRYPQQPNSIVKNNSHYAAAYDDLHDSPTANVRTSAYIKVDGDVTRVEGLGKLRKGDLWDYNTYSPKLFIDAQINSDRSGFLSGLEKWQAYTASNGNGFDANSMVVPLPSSPLVIIRPNDYEPGRAHIAVYAFGSKTASVDLSEVLESGSKYKIINVKNSFSEAVAEGIYSGSKIVLPIDGDFSAYLLSSNKF